ncbi:hypothetical protein [Hymenobacter glacieicola]|uniref:TonB-dependent receptor plug domain-containing protein n=1 Tax=Hymenobacter glacieicola TaxID=1562124 RepID=A0ABQ1WPG7_9BACT|nr:hypothetical protein [Hymenobacter glacieicola]GGG37979.1 hypothetical protein GCM10011378_12820 [Hymenobacter glacieicola]
MNQHLFRFLLLAGLTASAFRGHGHPPVAVSKARYAVAEPLYLLNSNSIMSSGFLPQLTPAAIAKVHIYKPNYVPPLLAGLDWAGIVAISYPKPIASQSLAQISRRHGVRGPFRVVIDGRLLSAEQVATLRMVPEAIGQVRVTPATPAVPEAVVAITLTKAKPVEHPPGTILIR